MWSSFIKTALIFIMVNFACALPIAFEFERPEVEKTDINPSGYGNFDKIKRNYFSTFSPFSPSNIFLEFIENLMLRKRLEQVECLLKAEQRKETHTRQSLDQLTRIFELMRNQKNTESLNNINKHYQSMINTRSRPGKRNVPFVHLETKKPVPASSPLGPSINQRALKLSFFKE